MPPPKPIDAESLALTALAAGMGEQRLAERFLSMSGLTSPELRQRADDPAVLVAYLHFLESYEPDLLLVAEKIGVGADLLVAARRIIEQ